MSDNPQEPLWAILDDYGYTPVRVVKETKSTVFYVDGYGRERKTLSALNWRGTEADARAISPKLQSANAEMNRRKRAANDWFQQQVATMLNERPNHEHP